MNRLSLKSYALGFGLSLVLTLAAYLAVVNEALPRQSLIAVIIGLALVQLFVQLKYFLHLGRESKPRWNLIVLMFAALVLLIVVLGTLWIMHNLNYNTMPPEELDHYLIEDEGLEQ